MSLFNRTALRRWERVAERPLTTRVRSGLLIALAMGSMFSVLAIVIALLQGSTVLHFRGGTAPLVGILASYLLGGPVTGALFGALFRGTRTVLGAYGVGLVAGLPVLVSTMSSVVGAGPLDWHVNDWLTGAIALATLGGIGGIIVRELAAA